MLILFDAGDMEWFPDIKPLAFIPHFQSVEEGFPKAAQAGSEPADLNAYGRLANCWSGSRE